MTFCLFPAHYAPEKRSSLKGRSLLPTKQILSFKSSCPFPKGDNNNVDIIASPKMYHVPVILGTSSQFHYFCIFQHAQIQEPFDTDNLKLVEK